MKSLARYDQGTIKSSSYFTEEGFLSCDAIVTRTGVFVYQNPDGTERRELRHPDDVLNGQSLDSMKMIPVTNNHPLERLVTADNAKDLSVGYTGENIKVENSFIYVNFKVTDKKTIDDVVINGKKELSLGYTVDLIEESGVFDGEQYDYRQTNIQYNHLSIVQSARAGSEARIALDASDAIEISNPNLETKNMVKRKVKIDEEEFMLEPEPADSVERLLEDMKNLEEEKERVVSELADVKERLEKTLAERDTAKEEATQLLQDKEEYEKEKMDSHEIQKMVKDRVKLLKVAESVLDSESIEKLDSLTDLEIKKKIIKAKSQNAKLDGKSEVYILARFDCILEDMSKSQVIVKTTTDSVTHEDDESSSEKARMKMINDMKNSYKKEVK